MNPALTCIALLGLLLFVLGISVSIMRGRRGVSIGCPRDPACPLHKLIRAHGNTAEYAPALMLLIYLLRDQAVGGWLLWVVLGVTLCRYLLVAGLLIPETMARPNPLRFIGALGTYLLGTVLSIELLRQTLV